MKYEPQEFNYSSRLPINFIKSHRNFTDMHENSKI